MLIGTAGHIDHGKTALIKALTGVDADRLKEEKARGITIDLGYAFAPLPNGEVLGFIDVPGHERFVHNMLAGATGIDHVLLVVAADDSVMPQTREHLEIVDLLGIAQGAVALTKIDRVPASRVAEVQAEIEQLFAGSLLAGSPVFPVSSINGTGIEVLRAHLESAAAIRQSHADDGDFRLAVDRCFTLTGSGTVVTGTVFAGRVQVGDKLVVSPSGKEVRVRSIHAQNRASRSGQAGQRCALNLAGVEKKDIVRGDWVLAPAVHAPTQRLDVRIKLPAAAKRALRHWTPVHLHVGAADVLGRISLLEGTTVEPGAQALAQLVLDQPVGSLRGDRFILRDQSAQFTLAGGVVLDPFAPARKVRTPGRLALLRAVEHKTAHAALETLLECSVAGVDLDWFARSGNLRRDAAESLYAGLPMVVVHLAGGQRHGFTPACWTTLQQAVLDVLSETHKREPELLGLEARRLRRLATPDLAWELFTALIELLFGEQRLLRHGPWLHLASHRVTLTPAEEKLWHAVAPLLRATPFQPPWVRDMATLLKVPETQMRNLLKRVTLLGDTYEVLRDRFFTREAITQLAQIATELDAASGAVQAAEFRDRVGCGRKLAIQILEYFDRTGFSRRVGDAHRMRDPALLVDKPKSIHAGTVQNAQITGRDSHPGGAT
jgi:selenocysteine-specific elongation factor